MTIRIKRIYDPPSADDGERYLVDRLWPRGVGREAAALADWLKDIAPSEALRKSFAHDPAKWDAFAAGYERELTDARDEKTLEALMRLVRAAARGPLTLLFAARDRERNNAVVLKSFLEKIIDSQRSP
jgi:uncharacterized protein YeaO (DUF488 family)